MTCETTTALLDRWMAGSIDPADRERVMRHADGCVECRARLADAEALRAHLPALRRGVAPPRNLYGGVRARIRPRRRIVTGPLLAAAAAVLLAIAAALLIPGARTHAPAPPSAAAGTAADRTTQLAAGYENAAESLARALEQRRAELSPATIAILERNLAVIDRAIAESRAALAADPANRDLEALLFATYEQKVALLQQATRLTSRS